jgi:hypothetical protein
MRLAQFNGGLKTVLEPHFLADNEATECVNVDLIRGVLKPIFDKTQEINSIGKYSYFFITENRWVSFAAETHFVEYKDTLYYTTGGTTYKIRGGVTYNLGIAAPTENIVVSATQSPKDVTRITKEDGVLGDFPAFIAVKYRFINRIVASSLTSEGLEEFTYVTNSSGTSSFTFSCPDTNFADAVDVYRYFDGAWRLATVIATQTGSYSDLVYDIANNPEYDSSSRGKLVGAISYGLTFINSLDGTESGLKLSEEIEVDHGNITISNIQISSDPQVTGKRLYRIGNGLTEFTLVAELDKAATSYEDVLGDTEIDGSLLHTADIITPPFGLKYLTEAYGMLFAALGDKLYFTSIGKPYDWRDTYYLDFTRPITGIARTPGALIIFDKVSAISVTGTGPTALSQQPLSGDQGCLNHNTIQYYKDRAIWVSADGLASSNGGAPELLTEKNFDVINFDSVVAVVNKRKYLLQLVNGQVFHMDLRTGAFKYCNYGTEYLVVGEEQLYGYSNGKLYSVETSDTVLPFSYRTKNFSANALTVFKGYKNIYISLIGDINVNIFIDNQSVVTYTFNSSVMENYQMKVPAKKGFHISFRITGTGTVYEISFDEVSING